MILSIVVMKKLDRVKIDINLFKKRDKARDL